MSTASAVPETYTLSGDDAREALRRTGRLRLARDSICRFIAADGTTHTRALAYISVLTLFPALIAVVGGVTLLKLTRARDILEGTVARLAPGPAGNILESALHQASRTSGTTALVAGAASALVSGTLAMAQMERGANRLYGMEADRTAIRRFSHAFAMNLTAGILLPDTQLSSASSG